MATLTTKQAFELYRQNDKTWTEAQDAANLAAAKAYTDEQIGNLPAAAEYSIQKAETPEDGYAASYKLMKDDVAVGATINIPKDYLVKSSSVKTVEAADTPVAGYKVGDKYVDFVVNTVEGDGNESHIYLLVSELVDVYKPGDGIEIAADNTVSVVAQDGTKTVGGITAEDYTKFNTAATTADNAKTAAEANAQAITDLTTRVQTLEGDTLDEDFINGLFEEENTGA